MNAVFVKEFCGIIGNNESIRKPYTNRNLWENIQGDDFFERQIAGGGKVL